MGARWSKGADLSFSLARRIEVGEYPLGVVGAPLPIIGDIPAWLRLGVSWGFMIEGTRVSARVII